MLGFAFKKKKTAALIVATIKTIKILVFFVIVGTLTILINFG